MPNIAFVNGKWCPLDQARVSVEDRGFQFGDGIYELIRTYDKVFFHLPQHLARLMESARQVQIVFPYTPARLERIIQTGCQKSGYKNTKIYIQITRGAAPRLHSFPKEVKATLVMTFREFKPIAPALRAKGIGIVSVPDIRWSYCNVKSLNLLPNVLARQQAVTSGGFEAVFVRQGKVYEGAGSNLFVVSGGKIVTPPKGDYLLSGITREIVIQLAKNIGLKVIEKNLRVQDLFSAEELFLTGTTFEVLPAISLDKKRIGSGKPGEITTRLYRAFQDHVHAETCGETHE